MKTIIFDFDGTLADSFELVLDIAAELTGIPRFPEKEIARLRHMPLTKAVKELHIPMFRLPRLVIKGRQRMSERIDEINLFPGVPEMLKSLHESGYHLLVMSSNSEQNVRSFLRTYNLEGYFDGVYGGVAVFNKATALKKTMRRNRLDPANCYYVGDEVRDIVAASKAKVEPIAVSWGYQAPEALRKYHPLALAKDPADLLAILASDKV